MLICQTIIIYTLLTIMMCYSAYRSQSDTKGAKLWAIMPLVLFTLVFGLRYGVGIDYNNYLEVYEKTEGYSLLDFWRTQRFEKGFSLIIYLCHLLGGPVYIFFSVFAFFQIFFIYKTFKDEGNILIYIYFTLITTGICILSFMNTIRQVLAFCIFIYSLKFIRDNKLFNYLLCIIVTISLHHSALILFPLYFIWRIKKGILHRPVMELVILIICFFSMYLTSWHDLLHQFDALISLLGYSGYIDRADSMITGGGRGVGLFGFSEMLIMCIIVINSQKMKNYFNSGLLNIIYDIFIVGICLQYVFNGSLLADRMILYFTHTKFIVLAYFLCYLYKTKKDNMTQHMKYALLMLFLIIQYGRFIHYCEQNTGAYVSYFQTDLHTIKDHQRDVILDLHEK